jgi:hypothetical protein
MQGHVSSQFMRNFRWSCLTLAFGFFVAIVFSYVPYGATVPSNVGIERARPLISLTSTNSNAVEKDSIRLEILMPERVWAIPANQPDANTPVRLGIRITNKAQIPIRFSRFDTLFPELVGLDGRALTLIGGRNVTIPPTLADCPIAQPEENLSFFLDGKLFWRDNKLELRGSDGFGGIWLFNELKPGNYQFRFTYSSPSSRTLPCDLAVGKMKGIWIGEVATPFVEIRLVQR